MKAKDLAGLVELVPLGITIVGTYLGYKSPSWIPAIKASPWEMGAYGLIAGGLLGSLLQDFVLHQENEPDYDGA